MALEEYRKKRDFAKTPEPAGASTGRRKQARALSFVVQKHRATRLHYDFRLELGGVLLSWAVPKGPSLDPHEKRLAVHVEDHPLEYGGFEGVIPKGQYGGGTVMVWDRGTWTPLDADPQAALTKGALKFRLEGEKLHGSWALVRMGGKAATEKHENWLLIKERDDAALPHSGDAVVADNPRSAQTGRSIEAIAADRDRVWDIERGEIAGDPPVAARPKGASKRSMPEKPGLQLATAAGSPPDGDDWLHEIKHDGYRLLGRIAGGEVRLTTRSGLDWTGKFPALARALAVLPVSEALIDGEVVALGADGTTNFGALQDAIARGDTGALVFFAFDLLHRDGYDLTGAAIDDRKTALAALLPRGADSHLRYSDHQVGRGPEFFRLACGHHLEGIVSKRRGQPYRSGRSTEWLKVKCVNRDEFIVIGFTEPAGARHGLGALLIGYHDRGGRLNYAGRVGTGFSDAQLADLRDRLAAMERADPPVAVPVGVATKGVHWSEPRLVIELRYGGWTADGILRHAAFLGLRDDKPAAEVVHDTPPNGAAAVKQPLTPPLTPRAGRGRAIAAAQHKPPAPARTERAGLGAQRREGEGEIMTPRRDGSLDFAGVRLTNPDRVFYPDAHVTKLALAQYYAAVADWALPQLAGRPLSLVRCPEGIGGQHFYQKHDMPGFVDAIGRVAIPDKSGVETHLYIRDLTGLVGLVQMGVIEVHPWGSTVDKLETPDRITFDFDPDEGLPWEQVTAAAIEMREALLGIGLRSFVKTTGGKGLHVVAPVTPRLGWDAVKEFAKWVSERFASAYPDRFTTNMAKRARTGRIFIDYLRNARGATAVGAYSPRARAGAPVATPLFWEEVEQGVKPAAFTVLTVPGRLAALKSDPWAELPTLRQSIRAAVRKEIGI